MPVFCEYHPTRSARLRCPNCLSNYCTECASKRPAIRHGKESLRHFCPKCDLETEWLSSKNIIVPFWNRLPKFFVYPFHLRTMLLMSALSVATLLFSSPTLFGAVMRIAIWGIFLKYSFEALKETAQGNLAPPGVNLGTISNDFQVVFKQLGIFIVIGLVFMKVLAAFGVFFGFIFLCLCILSVPAMIILLVVTNSFLKAINPLIFGKMALRMGLSRDVFFSRTLRNRPCRSRAIRHFSTAQGAASFPLHLFGEILHAHFLPSYGLCAPPVP